MKIPHRFNRMGISPAQASGVKPLTITTDTTNAQVSIYIPQGSPDVSGLQYRLGTSGEWLPYTINTEITLEHAGDSIQFQNTNTTLNSSGNTIRFNLPKVGSAVPFTVSGSLMSLYNYIDTAPATGFGWVFQNSGTNSTLGLKNAENLILPGGEVLADTFYSLFEGCSNLLVAPKVLPATTLNRGSYQHMFHGCTSLTTPPIIQAITLKEDGQFMEMFNNAGLTTPPKFKCTTFNRRSLNYLCYQTPLTSIPKDMFMPNTQFTNSGTLRWTFASCRSLTSADLSNVTYVEGSWQGSLYYSFYNCSSLSEIKAGWSSWNTNYHSEWVSGVASDGTFYCPTALGTNGTIDRGTNKCPRLWTVINTD